jgi:hypothetical protein
MWVMGRIQSEHLAELENQVKESRAGMAFDLDEVTLIGIDAVRFLGEREANGIQLLRCSPYMCEWIVSEQKREK